MKLIRVLTETPAEATDLIAFLDSRGFAVQTSDKSDLFSPSVDLEIDLRVVPLSVALEMAHGLVPDKMNSFLIPDFFTEAVFGQEPSPAQFRIIDVPPGLTHRDAPILDMRALAHPEYVPTLELTRRGNLIHKKSNEAALIVRDWLTIIAMQLRKACDRSRDWLEETRAVCTFARKGCAWADFLSEYRSRFAWRFQRAWINRAIASAPAIMLLMIMPGNKPNDPPTRGQLQIASPLPIKHELLAQAQELKATPMHRAATSIPHRRSVPRRHTVLLDDDEVLIVHHYDRLVSKPVVAENPAGSKHFSATR